MSAPRFVRLSVSGARPTLNEPASNSVTVRQHPLIAIESPIWQSLRMGAASEMVSDQPPPPLSVVSSSDIADTVPRCSICPNGGVRAVPADDAADDAYEAGEHCGD